MKLLNLDELTTVNRQVVINGATYSIVEQSVGEMVEAVQTAKRIENAKDDPEVVLQAMIDTAHRLMPDCPRAALERLTMQQLSKLIQFATAADEEVVAEAKAAEAGDDTAGKS